MLRVVGMGHFPRPRRFPPRTLCVFPIRQAPHAQLSITQADHSLYPSRHAVAAQRSARVNDRARQPAAVPSTRLPHTWRAAGIPRRHFAASGSCPYVPLGRPQFLAQTRPEAPDRGTSHYISANDHQFTASLLIPTRRFGHVSKSAPGSVQNPALAHFVCSVGFADPKGVPGTGVVNVVDFVDFVDLAGVGHGCRQCRRLCRLGRRQACGYQHQHQNGHQHQ